MLKKSQEYFANLKNKLLTYRNKEVRDNEWNLRIQEEHIPRNVRPSNEHEFLLCTFYFSVSIVCCKILYANKECFRDIFTYGRKLVSTSMKIIDIDVLSKISSVLVSLWAILAEFSWLLMPAFAGLGMTVFTWRMVYLHSSVPGVEPPSPFSPLNYNVPLMRRFHSGYKFALFIGVVVFFISFFKWNSLFM